MDESNLGLFNTLRIVGPLVFFVVVFAMLHFMTDLGAVKSGGVALVIALVDYFILTWLMRRVGGN